MKGTSSRLNGSTSFVASRLPGTDHPMMPTVCPSLNRNERILFPVAPVSHTVGRNLRCARGHNPGQNRISMHHQQVIGTLARRLTAVAALVLSVGNAGAQDGTLGTGGIRGIVRDSTGQAIIGAQIAFAGSALIAESDDSGRFEVAKVRPGMLQLRFRRLGYQ